MTGRRRAAAARWRCPGPRPEAAGCTRSLDARRAHACSARRAAPGALAAAAVTGLVLAACAVDTELGLDATVSSAVVTVTSGGAAPSTSIDARVTVAFRVGEHAQGVRRFVPVRVDVAAPDGVVSVGAFEVPRGFDGSLSPGESAEVRFDASCAGDCASRGLCSGAAGDGSSVPITFFWEDRGLSPPEPGSTMGTATLRCVAAP